VNFFVENKEVAVGAIRIIGVAASSVFLIGDTEVITCSSMFDTPPESLIIGRIAPLPAPQGAAGAQGAPGAAGAQGAAG
jgi:spore germination protein PD